MPAGTRREGRWPDEARTMSRSSALAKLAKAAELTEQAAKLQREAADEIEAEDSPAPSSPITDDERALMRKRFRKMGHGA